MASLAKTKEVEVNGKRYIIPFPKIRHQLDIESRKQLLSQGTYGLQERSGTEDSDFNLNLIDAIAHIGVLCPEMLKDITGAKPSDTVDPYEMELSDAKWLMKAWNEIAPWYRDIKKEVNSEMIKTKDNKSPGAGENVS